MQFKFKNTLVISAVDFCFHYILKLKTQGLKSSVQKGKFPKCTASFGRFRCSVSCW